MNLELGKYKACICEGAAEQAIMDILLDEHLLIFERNDMLDEQVIRCRDADTLIDAIKKYTQISKIPKGEYTLLDLLK